jgi:hypothetical protein
MLLEEGPMRVPLTHQAQASLGHNDLVRSTERIDDGARLIGQLVQMGFVEGLDRHRPRPGRPRGRRWGWRLSSPPGTTGRGRWQHPARA